MKNKQREVATGIVDRDQRRPVLVGHSMGYCSSVGCEKVARGDRCFPLLNLAVVGVLLAEMYFALR